MASATPRLIGGADTVNPYTNSYIGSCL